MTKRLNEERQNTLEPKRIEYAVRKLTELGINIITKDNRKIEFQHKGSIVTLYPYSGWFTGKTVKDGRGITNLLGQLNGKN